MKWKESPTRKPLILKGVRQCGKTWILRDFGARCYRETAYFNFEENPLLGKLFEKDYDVKRILFELSLFRGKAVNPENDLIFFDEIQECGKAITSLKYFCENAPEYHIVCAGSLLGVALQEKTSFPVGKVDFLTLTPMNFTEFLAACGEKQLADYIGTMKKGSDIPEAVGGKLTAYFRQYEAVGGMPAAVGEWIVTHDIGRVEKIQKEILNSYEMDFVKHAPSTEFTKLTAIWRSIPAQLAKDNSKFIFGQVKKGCWAKDLENALEWLLGAGLIYKVRRIEKPFLPLSAYADDTVFKLYLADIGLLRCLSELPFEALTEGNPNFTEFKGALTENAVLTELISGGIPEAFYWTSGNEAEVDFVVGIKGKAIPIEVKSERNLRARSLREYRRKYSPETAVKTSLHPFVEEGEILNLPLPVLSALPDYL